MTAKSPRSAFESHGLASNGLLPLPLSRVLYEELVGEFNIAPNYLSVLSTGIATYISPSTKTNNTKREHARKPEKKCFRGVN